ncbi:MAG: hypothetical protein V9E81_10085 [Marmoricola sp.]
MLRLTLTDVSGSAMPLAAAGAAAVALPAVGRWGAGSAEALAGGASPHASYTIKGNADSMLYHTTESPYYGRTIAEAWFNSEGAAQAAGFTRWDQRVREPKVAKLVELPAAGAYGDGSAKPLAGGASPHESFTIKGNADSMLYHTTESPYYGRTIAEVWFNSEDKASAAGFTRWDQRVREPKVAKLVELPAAGAYGEGSAEPLAGGASPHESFTIKGNADSMLYHTTESPYYGRTIAEVWFNSEDKASAAGFTRWDQRVREPKVAGFADLPAQSQFGAGSADPLEGGASPHASFTIKGNADSMLFHPEDSPYYGRTIAEVWFNSEEAALAAAIKHWKNR